MIRKIFVTIIVLLFVGSTGLLITTFFKDISWGKLLYKYYNFDAAKKKFEKVLSEDPLNKEAHLYLGLIYGKEGNLPLAFKHLRYIENHIENLKLPKYVYKEVGILYYLHEEYSLARKFFSIASKKNKYDYEALFYTGLCFALEGKNSEALNTFKKVIRIHKCHPLSLWNIAVILEEQNNYPEALKYWRRYRKCLPAILRTPEIDKRIRKLEEAIKEGKSLEEKLNLKGGERL